MLEYYSNTMNMISESQRELYRTEGYMILPGVIPPDLLEMLREECSYYLGYYDSIMDAKGVQTEGISHRGKRYFINNRYRLSNRLWRFIFSDLMAEVAKATVGPEAYLFHEQWVVKGAEQGMKFSWHQDSGYVKWYDPGTRHKPYVTCWCTLDAVNEENGTVYLLPHSRGGTRDKIIDHFNVFHRSGPNKTDRMRRIYLPQYSGAPIHRPDGKPWAMATPFIQGGRNVYDHANDSAEKFGPFPDRKKEAA